MKVGQTVRADLVKFKNKDQRALGSADLTILLGDRKAIIAKDKKGHHTITRVRAGSTSVLESIQSFTYREQIRKYI